MNRKIIPHRDVFKIFTLKYDSIFFATGSNTFFEDSVGTIFRRQDCNEGMPRAGLWRAFLEVLSWPDSHQMSVDPTILFLFQHR